MDATGGLIRSTARGTVPADGLGAAASILLDRALGPDQPVQLVPPQRPQDLASPSSALAARAPGEPFTWTQTHTGLTLMAGGVVLAGTGGFFGYQASVKQRQILATPQTDPASQQLRARGQLYAAVADALFVSALAAGAAGGYFAFLAPGRGPEARWESPVSARLRPLPLAVFAATTACGFACSLFLHFDPEGQPCDAYGECLRGYACVDGACHQATDACGGCPEGERCRGTGCVEDICLNRLCPVGQDCIVDGQGTRCRTVAPPALLHACAGDGDCEAGRLCVVGSVPGENGAPRTGVCVEPCDSDGGCATAGAGCHTFSFGLDAGAQGLCLPPIAVLECQSDAPCGSEGFVCAVFGHPDPAAHWPVRRAAARWRRRERCLFRRPRPRAVLRVRPLRPRGRRHLRRAVRRDVRLREDLRRRGAGGAARRPRAPRADVPVRAHPLRGLLGRPHGVRARRATLHLLRRAAGVPLRLRRAGRGRRRRLPGGDRLRRARRGPPLRPALRELPVTSFSPG